MGVYFIVIMFYTPITNEFLIPTLSRSFAVAPFQSIPLGSSVLTVLPSNPAERLRVSVWDKSANYFETACPQFRFCPEDKNELVLWI